MPFGMRTRIMKWPGVGLRWKTPNHFSRSLSSSAMVFQPSRAKRTRSSETSSPSFSALSASILFMPPLVLGHGQPPEPDRAGLELRLARERIPPLSVRLLALL